MSEKWSNRFRASEFFTTEVLAPVQDEMGLVSEQIDKYIDTVGSMPCLQAVTPTLLNDNIPFGDGVPAGTIGIQSCLEGDLSLNEELFNEGEKGHLFQSFLDSFERIDALGKNIDIESLFIFLIGPSVTLSEFLYFLGKAGIVSDSPKGLDLIGNRRGSCHWLLPEYVMQKIGGDFTWDSEVNSIYPRKSVGDIKFPPVEAESEYSGKLSLHKMSEEDRDKVQMMVFISKILKRMRTINRETNKSIYKTLSQQDEANNKLMAEKELGIGDGLKSAF